MSGHEIDITNAFMIIGLAILTALFAEMFAYIIIYRKDYYKDLIKDATGTMKRLDKDRKALNPLSNNFKKLDRKIKMDEKQLKGYSSKLASTKMKSTAFIGICMIGIMNLMSNYFSGIVVAKLPFTPFSLMTGITHRNLEGEDYTDCSMIFLYILANVCFRPMTQKLLGFDGPRGLQQNNMFPEMPKE